MPGLPGDVSKFKFQSKLDAYLVKIQNKKAEGGTVIF